MSVELHTIAEREEGAPILGVDVSGYSQGANYNRIKAGPHQSAECFFGIVKTTQDNLGVNKLAPDQAMQLCSRGCIVGTYHFAVPNGPDWEADGVAEAKSAIAHRIECERACGDYDAGFRLEGPIYLDLEKNRALTADEIKGWRIFADAFAKTIEEAGYMCAAYGSTDFLRKLALGLEWAARPLWQAEYHIPFVLMPMTPPKSPGPWESNAISAGRAIWQHGGGATLAGGGNAATWPGFESCPGNPQGISDVNVFYGTRTQLLRHWGKAT